MTVTDHPVDNGVAVEALLGAREVMTDAPEAAAFVFRADCTWVNGTHSRTSVERFFGMGAEQSHRTAFVLDTDHPELFAAADRGITPPEMILTGLVGCLAAGIASVAQNRGVQLRSVTATVEGDMDLRGILGIDADVRNGFEAIRVRFSVDTHAPREEIEAIVAQSQKRSAVFDIVANPTVVTVEVG